MMRLAPKSLQEKVVYGLKSVFVIKLHSFEAGTALQFENSVVVVVAVAVAVVQSRLFLSTVVVILAV